MDFYGTIGPACAQPAILQHMVEAGMTGIRMNLSHGPLAAHTDWLAMIRAAGIRQLLIDLQGPELRIGTLAEPVALVEGSSVRLGADGIPCPAALVQAAAPGQQLLLDDGKLLVQVTQTLPGALLCTVVRGGTLQSRKSIAAPGLAVHSPTLTEEDLQNLKIAKQCGVTGVMLPFVRGKADILALRSACFSIQWQPGEEQFALTTWGYGHGVGLSQEGAQNMAENGADCEEILLHYYTGVTIGSIQEISGA